MNINVNVTGIEKLTKKISGIAGQAALNNADKITETYTRKMANESAAMAPVLDNILAPSIAASPEPLGKGVWQYGSTLEYARRQEYENASHKGFIRKSVWNNRTPYREALKKEFTRW
ncbi:hypothetical protein [Bacillus sp. FSL K6-3431]|uniref:hypothetical protein n=1 Tax=Bacillus sp. FSL K6-3431 TaxID=2921500 RepID=UPI0030F53137